MLMCIYVFQCLPAGTEEKPCTEMHGNFSSWWKHSGFFLHFLNIQDVLECIYDFYNQKKKCVWKRKSLFKAWKSCADISSH